MIEIKTDIYEILLEIMEERSMNIPDVARACGLSDSTVRGIITRKQKSVALEVAFKLAFGLNVSLERLNGMPEAQDNQMQEIENASNPDESELEAGAWKLYRALIAGGYVKEGEDITEKQLEILDGLSAIIAASFDDED